MEYPASNPEPVENELNYMQAKSNEAYTLYRQGELTEDDRQIAKEALQRSKEILHTIYYKEP